MLAALPGCSLFLGIPYTPVRRIIEAGLPLALVPNLYPGSGPSGNMNSVVSLDCLKMNMLPEEAISAAALNGAYATGLEYSYGSITQGKAGNVLITKEISHYNYLPYAFGQNSIGQVLIKGRPFP